MYGCQTRSKIPSTSLYRGAGPTDLDTHSYEKNAFQYDNFVVYVAKSNLLFFLIFLSILIRNSYDKLNKTEGIL